MAERRGRTKDNGLQAVEEPAVIAALLGLGGSLLAAVNQPRHAQHREERLIVEDQQVYN